MPKKKINNKITHSIISIITTIVIFVSITFIINKNTPDNWVIKHQFKMSEKAIIYLNNIDMLVNELRIKDKTVLGLKSSVDQMMVKEIRAITAAVKQANHTAKDQSSIRWELGYIIFKVKDLKEANNYASKIIKNVNERISKDLDIKLNLYSEIARNRVKEQDDYIISQIERISKLQAEQRASGYDDITLDDYVNYLKKKLIGSDQEITVESMREFVDELGVGASKVKKREYLERLRKRYAIDGIDNNIQLNQLDERIKELKNIEIVSDGYITSSKNAKIHIIPKLGMAALLGLSISLLFSYFYLTFHMKLFKKKLHFYLYRAR